MQGKDRKELMSDLSKKEKKSKYYTRATKSTGIEGVTVDEEGVVRKVLKDRKILVMNSPREHPHYYPLELCKIIKDLEIQGVSNYAVLKLMNEMEFLSVSIGAAKKTYKKY